MRTLQSFRVESTGGHRVQLLVDGRHRLTVAVLGERLMRVWLQPGGTSLVDRTWMIAPGGDVPWEGRPRESIDGFDLPEHRVDADDDRVVIATGRLRVEIDQQPLRLTWSYRRPGGEWQPLVKDRPTGAYAIGADGVAHYQDRPPGHRYFGLGEKAGDLERTGRRFEFRGLDALGYNAVTTDPLYKHVPFTLTANPGQPFGLLYDNLATSWFDLGCELDNYHPWYRRYTAECGDLDYYLFCADDMEEVTRQVVALTGRTAFPPKWSLGYSGSTMTYTDAPDAAERLVEFLDLCREHRIPCDSFQLSSGYTSMGDMRCVFTWNRAKFPDPTATTETFHQSGVHLAANIKPALQQDHPYYDEVAATGLFVRDEVLDGPEVSNFWGFTSSHLDFTNPDTVAWWKEQVTGQLLAMGIDSTWNDNNEFEVWPDECTCAGFGRRLPVRAVRPLFALLMNRASHEAQRAHTPGRRPHQITRSGPLGLQRYAQTWSGDNATSWDTLRYNTKMGVGMSMSGLYNIGHDVGGFAGPKPDPELFVRWVQNGVLHPRFTIHSWNSDLTVNEPWMYPSVTDEVRAAIELRYRLLPYLYTLLWRAHTNHDPMIRPVWYAFDDDPAAMVESFDFLLGPELLVASVVEEGARSREILLPAGGHGWYELDTGRHHAPGQTVTLDAPLQRLPVLVRAGGALPLSDRLAHVDPAADTVRTLQLWPAPAAFGEARTEGVVFEDDGVSEAWADGDCLVVWWTMTSDADEVRLSLRGEGTFQPAWGRLRIDLPEGETRRLSIDDPDGLAAPLPETQR